MSVLLLHNLKKCMCMQLWLIYHLTSSPPDGAPYDTQSSPSPSSSVSRHSSVDSDHATREFIDFLKPLKSGREIFKQCRAFTESMVYKRVSLKQGIHWLTHNCKEQHYHMNTRFVAATTAQWLDQGVIINWTDLNGWQKPSVCVLAGFCPV